MNSLIRVLHLEDSPRDAELIEQKLKIGGLACNIVLVNGKEEFESALARDVFDVILYDHNLPDYDGRSALRLARKRLPGVPVISLSGTLGEEEAVECLKQGATDYVLKRRLERLVPAVRRALQEAEEHRARLQAEAASRASEAQFRAMFEVASIGMAQADPRTGQWLRVNQKMCAITGYSAAELLGMRVPDLTHPDDRQKDWAQFERVVRGEAADYRMEKRYLRKDGTVAWVNVNMTVIRDAAGQPVRTMAAIEDITERKRAEERVRELNLLLRATGAVSALMVRERDPKRLLTEACHILVETRGYRFVWIGLIEPGSKRVVPQGRAGRDSGYFDSLSITWDETPTGQGPIGTAIRTGQRVACQDIATDPRLALYRKEAKARGIASMAALPIIHGSRVLGAMAVYSERAGTFHEEELGLLNELAGDLAFALQSIEHEQERTRAEATVRQRETYFQALTEGATDVTTLLDADGTMRYQSPSVEPVLGYAPDELAGRGVFEFIHPDDLALVQQALAEVTATPGVTTRIEFRFRHKDNSWHVLEANARNLLHDRNVKGVIAHSRDNTERKRLEEALRESSELNRQIVASAQEGIIVYGRDQKYQVWNPFMEQLTGIPAGQVLGKNPEELFPFLREAGVLASIQKTLAGEPTASHEFHFESLQTGKSGWAHHTNGPLRNAAGEIIGVIGIVRDITERKRTQESHARLATAVEQAAETIVITDASGTILYANPAFERTSGYTRAEALGQNPRILKSGKHDAEFYLQMWAVLGRGEVWSGRLINKKKDGTLYEEDATISPMRDPAGKVVNYVAVKRDVTREAQLEAQLRQAQKMEAVGQLAGGVAHDFNNMLAVIRGNAELLLMDGEQFTAGALECLKQVVAASERAANLTRQLLAFSRKQVLQPQPLVLNGVITNLAKKLKRVIGENIDLQCHYAEPLPHIQADPGMMEQVILNLVVNARDAMPQGGQLCVATESARFGEADAQTDPEGRAGEFVCLKVTDTGAGIAPEVLPRIFEPFFTTKQIGRGTGLGLATVYGIVKQHTGWIEVSSEVGEGSTFKVFLPAIPTPAGLTAAGEVGADIRGGNETILLVEDDLAVRLTTRRVLESKGYAVREATNAREALEQWQRHAGEIALLLTDIIMPEEMTGRDLAERLWGQRPGLKVIFMSGYSADVLGTNTEFIRRTKSRFLMKPCSARTLLEAVRQCLDVKEPESASCKAGRAK